MLSALWTGLFSQSAGIGELDYIWNQFFFKLHKKAYFLLSTGSKLTRQIDGSQNVESQNPGFFFFSFKTCVTLYPNHIDQFPTNFPGWEDPHQVDCSWSHRLPEVLFGQRRVELRNCHVGGDVLRREALLGDVQPGCEYCPGLTCNSFEVFFESSCHSLPCFAVQFPF